MAKLENGNLRLTIQIAALVITLAGVAIATGKMLNIVEANGKEIARVDEQGCRPSKVVLQRLGKMDEIDIQLRRDLQRIEGENKEAHIRLEGKIDKILDTLISHSP